MDKRYIGDLGEDFAAKTLSDKGYIILSRNYTCRTGEIDIIAKDKDTFVFVEVKTRKNNLYGNHHNPLHHPVVLLKYLYYAAYCTNLMRTVKPATEDYGFS